MTDENGQTVNGIDLGIEGLGLAVHLGAGGSANVYAASRASTGELVAVKLLRASADNPKDRARFTREQETLKRLEDDDGIVPILDAGVTDRNEPYFLMPLLAGSLQDRIESGGGLSWELAVELMALVADSVEHAHQNGVLHRDLKPGNILVDDNGVPGVSDFGIAKIMDASVSKSSKAMGTPNYMPPEQFRGESATERSDVYGLAATLVALVSGAAPFLTGKNDTEAAVMMRVVSEAPPTLDGFGVPPEISELVVDSMSKDPLDRPQSAAEFAERLRSAVPDLDPDKTVTRGALTIPVPPRNIKVPVVTFAPPAEPKAAVVADDSGSNKFALVAAAVVALVVVVGAVLFLTRGDGDVETATSVEVAEQDEDQEDEDEAEEEESEPVAADDVDVDVDVDQVDDELEVVETEVAGASAASDETAFNDGPSEQEQLDESAGAGSAVTPPAEEGGTAAAPATETVAPVVSQAPTPTVTETAAPVATPAPTPTVTETAAPVATPAPTPTVTEAAAPVVTPAPTVDPPPTPDNHGCAFITETQVRWAWSPLPRLVDNYQIEFSNGTRSSLLGDQVGQFDSTNNAVRRIIAIESGVESATTVGSCEAHGGTPPTPDLPGLPQGVRCEFHDFFFNAQGTYTWSETWFWSSGGNTDSYRMVINQDGEIREVDNGSSTTHTTVGVNGQSNSGRSVKGIIAVGNGLENKLTIANCGGMGGTGWVNP